MDFAGTGRWYQRRARGAASPRCSPDVQCRADSNVYTNDFLSRRRMNDFLSPTSNAAGCGTEGSADVEGCGTKGSADVEEELDATKKAQQGYLANKKEPPPLGPLGP